MLSYVTTFSRIQASVAQRKRLTVSLGDTGEQAPFARREVAYWIIWAKNAGHEGCGNQLDESLLHGITILISKGEDRLSRPVLDA